MAGFTPIQSAIGGALVGSAAVGKLLLTGKILGVSGIVKGLFQGDWSPWRWTFISGIVSGGCLAASLVPGVFEAMNISAIRAAAGGLLVGLGSSMGNGCTSGHGICGNARLSIRSMVYTVVFMASGFVTANLANTAAAFNLASTAPQYTSPTSSFLRTAGILIPASMIAMAIPALIASRPKKVENGMKTNPAASNLAEYSTGAVFGLGLGLSGMTLPSKIVAFLSVLHPGFDLSLIFVMGGALLVALPGMQYILNGPKTRSPICGGELKVPKKKGLDTKLLLGGVIFGMGWGISGLCPGPALANITNPSSPLFSYLAGMGGGFLLDRFVTSPLLKRN